MKILYHLILSFVSLSFLCCTDNSVERHLLRYCEQNIDENPSSVASLMDSVPMERFGSNENNKNKYLLLKMRMQNAMGRPFMHIDSMRQVFQYYDKRQDSFEKTYSCYMIGRAYYLMGDMMMAIDYYSKCLEDSLHTDDSKYNILLSKVHSQLSLIYHEQKLPDLEEREIYSAEYDARVAGDTLLAQTYRQFLYSPFYLRNDHKGVVRVVNRECKKLIEMGERTKAAQMQTVLLTSYLAFGDYASAKRCIDNFEQESGYFDSCGNILRGKEIFFNKKGLYYFGIQCYDSAEYYFRKLLSYSYDFNNVVGAYGSLLALYRKQGMTDSIGKYAYLYCIANDSAHKQLVSGEIIRNQQMYNYTMYRNEVERQTDELRRERTKTWIVVTGFVALVMIVAMLIWHEKRRLSEHRRKLTSEYGRAMSMKRKLEQNAQDKENELARLERELSLMRESMKRENVSISEMNVDGMDFLDILHICAKDSLHGAECVTSEDWRKLESYVHKTEQEFCKFVEAKKMADSELHAVMLTRLGFSNDEIQHLIGIRGNSYTNLKSRVVRKLFSDGSAKDFVKRIRMWGN